VLDRSISWTTLAVFFICLLGPGAVSASVKCQCNNGMLAEAMDADYGDDDVEQACEDACSELGGGHVWTEATDGEDHDVTVDERPRGRGPAAVHR
jgi:hypothetical protein